MKLFYFIIFTCFLFSKLHAQKPPVSFRVKNGEFSKDKNLVGKKITSEQLNSLRFKNRYYLLLQFDRLPQDIDKRTMASKGIRLFDYLPPRGFLAEITDSNAINAISQFHANAAYDLAGSPKIAAVVAADPERSQKEVNTFLAVNFFGSVSKEEAASVMQQLGAQIAFTKIQPTHTLFVKASPEVIQKIAALPFVSYLGEQVIKDIPLNYNNRATHSLDALNATSGRNLQGKNVTVGMGDDSDPSGHIDFVGRSIVRTPGPVNNHGTHTTGTVGGGGIIDPRYRGMASKSTLVNQLYSDILVNAPVYVNDYNMVLTNNSYFSGALSCPGEGEYNSLSAYVDAQLNAEPFLLHDFAAGNDGGTTCTPYPNSFATIKSGFQCGKNVLTVGAIDNTNYTIADFSSRGPVNDGRLKPEIVAGGVNIISTIPYNNYYSFQGTSMASPTVTGTMALLVERYRQLHAGANPLGSLLKAVACNSADDLGVAGPDFTFGFGMLNARASVETIENNEYFLNAVDNGNFATHTISNVPAGAQVKIMLYWSDPDASPSAVTTLVNDLDLQVTGADAIPHLPLILNSNPLNVNDPAQEGADHINNIEQVVFTNTTTGDVSIKVNGTNIPSGPQNYVVAYKIINPSVTVEYPFGSETLVPGQSENIRWSSFGGGTNSFNIDYSSNNGATWTSVATNVASTARTFTWTVPATPTNAGLIRVTRNVAGYSDVSDYPFTILGQPVITATKPCTGYIQLNWPAITGATQYEIMKLQGDSMQTFANTVTPGYLLSGLSKDSTYWLAVRAVNNTNPGRRSIAVQLKPNSGACSTAFYNNDFTIDSLITPATGRRFTSTQLGITAIQVRIRNLGPIISGTSFAISYQVNGGTIITENASLSIAAKGTSNYTFSVANSYDFSAVGTYSVQVWVKNTGDGQAANDTLTRVVKELQNDPLTLAPNFTEGFETAAAQTYSVKTLGLTGLDRCDYSSSGPYPRIRTFVNTGFARTGNRCITMDQSRDTAVTSTDSVITTFNLSNYTATDQIWLDFYYKNHGTDFVAPGNKVWIRGNDQAAWIAAYTLPISTTDFGTYQSASSINITEVLATAGQTISSSFQVKFGQQGYTSANSVIPDADLDDGFSIDDVSLTKSSNDVGMSGLLQPDLTNTCGLSANQSVSVQLKNYTTAPLGTITVSYAINGDTVTEIIPSIAPGISTYTFTQTADLSAFKHYVLTAWVTYAADNYHKNDTLPVKDFYTTPLIASYPYLEGFEANNGYWYAQGINSSWAWGAPAKTVINKAANGNNAWVTNLTGNYNDNELSYLYSPCFDLSSLTSPVLSFSHIFQTEDNCDCDYHWVEYSLDGVTWTKLGAVGAGTNWYDYAAKQAWKASNPTWHVSSYYVPTNAAKVRFRIVMSSDQATNYEGVGIDDINIFDKAAIYSGANVTSGLSQTVNGSNWIHFTMGGKRIASINPHGQNLGATGVKVYFNTGPIRNVNNQYYLDRNIVIQTTNAPTAPVSVRYYFLDTEAKKLIAATGCGTCTTIADAYAAGVTQYSNAPAEEDGSLTNNIHGLYRYILPHTEVSVIPYDSGYYAEYTVNRFSEFWINGGGITADQPLPVLLEQFTATRSGSQGLLQWTTSQEENTNAFIIEKSTDGNTYYPIGNVAARGNSSIPVSYQFTDKNLTPGKNYYRLKMTDLDGQFSYSPIRTIDYSDNNFSISVYPNPVSQGVIYIVTSASCTHLELYDISGRKIRGQNAFGLQNTLSVSGLTPGVYLLDVQTAAGRKIEKILIE